VVERARKLVAEIAQTSPDALVAETLLISVERWDSMRMVQLVVRLEQALGRELSEAEIVGLETLAGVEALLAPVAE
jgi:acyl carrier protein